MAFVFLFILSGCTAYQSSGREAIEKGTVNVVSGFLASKAALFECFRSHDLPSEILGASEVIETPLESVGLSTLLFHDKAQVVVLYMQKDKPNKVEYCHYKTVREFVKKDLVELAEHTQSILLQ